MASTAETTTDRNSNSDHLRQKRARSQLSCTPCRLGKLKCNREKPACDQCTKRGRESACLFLPPPAKHKPAQNVKGRIRQLENLVVDLMNQNRAPPVQPGNEGRRSSHTTPATASTGEDGQQQSSVGPYSQPTPPSDSDTVAQFSAHSQQSGDWSTPPRDDIDAATAPFGQLKISKNEIRYVGESHWDAILNSISDLKQDLGDDDDDEGDQPEHPLREDADNVDGTSPQGVSPHATTGIGFMLGSSVSVTKAQLIAAIPEKRVADRLLSLWFNAPDPFKPIVHAPTFQEEYKRFWLSPKDTPIMWLGLTFAILSNAASFGLRDLDPDTPQAQQILADVNRYHSLAASAAVLADFTKPKEYTLECLILYTGCLRSKNAFVNVWLMVGLIVRLALRMGYHRDAKHYPKITPFQGEMRRRTWAMISMVDVLFSFQLGLPSMVKTIHSDTQPPRNLLDRDFNVQTRVLPPNRSIDELTPSSYTRAKLRITRIFADAAEVSHATVPPAYEDIMQLDRQLEEAKAAIPPLLQMVEISEFVTDPAEQLMCGLNLDLLYLKTKLVLHRRYMLTPFAQLSPQEQQIGVGISRKYCIVSALRVLQHHHTIYNASQPGGQLESVKWYMGSISTHDFLLAAMVICLELSSQLHDDTFRASPDCIQCPERPRMLEALQKSQQIWDDSSRRKDKSPQFSGRDENMKAEYMFDETEKAAHAMAVMLKKVKKQFGARGYSNMPDAQANASASGGGSATAGMPVNADNAPNSGLQGSIAAVSQQDAPNGLKRTFNGVVGTYDWGDMAGVPQLPADGQLDFGALASSGDATYEIANNQSGVGEGTGYVVPQPDYSVIGDMLDVTGDLDWEMWDSEIVKGQQLPMSDWPDQPPDLSHPNDVYGRSYDNPLVGRPTPVVAGDTTVPGGTGPNPDVLMNNSSWRPGPGVGSVFGTANMDFGMDLPLDNVDDLNFDLGIAADYDRSGMYPASKADWEDWHKRKSQNPAT
ncbi:hypothetical protein LTR36_000341 [Oleoguttula mirabilis]|uniref:Zn(2)-C6 fungal-type domain-containing protein n=1 Tax=Oleoguttula mirabilis TaxID=1507867 RepID=A0AAV9K0B6_9PEZI|nr:hypothetical protein LTR36_000341 [Oleoguttula mirabilis]